MMETGFSSPRNDAFPAGLRVLVVDDDPTWLKILEKMLKKCSYEVTTCGLARDALNLLRERKDGYDVVICDVNMPDSDGFKLLEHVGLEMDLPVIMMSADGETSKVMKGVQHGACDYILKPIRMKELQNIWQHVFRKKIHEVRDIEILEGMERIAMGRNGFDQSDDGHLFCGEDLIPSKKRKDIENKHDDKDAGEVSSTKKARVVWSVDLHQKFIKAVNQIGFDKVGPKKILDLMNVPWLMRENVASHLQKYRLYLSRLQKEKDFKTSLGGIKNSDSPLRNSLLVANLEPGNHDSDRMGIVPKNAAEPKGKCYSEWSAIAARLPGRTDNDIKNYWHTHLKKKIASAIQWKRDVTPVPSEMVRSLVREMVRSLERERGSQFHLEGNYDSKTSVGCSNAQNPISCIQESCASNHSSGFSAQSCFNYGSSSSRFSVSIDTQHSFNMLHIEGRLVQSEELGSSDDKLNDEEAALMPEGPCTISESTDIIESDASFSDCKNSKPEDSSNSSTSSGSDDDDMAGFHSTFLFGPKPDE